MCDDGYGENCFNLWLKAVPCPRYESYDGKLFKGRKAA